MKYYSIIALMIGVLACNLGPSIDYVILSGHIENQNEPIISINGDEVSHEIKINEDGSFLDTLELVQGFYTLSHGGETTEFFVQPGDNLQISLNTRQFDENLKYEGKGAENNNYLASKVLAEEEANLDFKEIYAMDEADFLVKLEEIRSGQQELLKSAEKLSPDFLKIENDNLRYDYLSNLQMYREYHEYFTGKEGFETSVGFLDPLKGVDYNDETAHKHSKAYRQLVNGYFNNVLKYEESDEFKSEISKISSASIGKSIAKDLAYNLAPSYDKNALLYESLMALSQDEKFKTDLSTKYEKIKALGKGMPSPVFENYENHKGGHTSLTDLKGKYTYIDIWATWCGPCKREIPSLKAVEEEYHDKNIQFLSISIDKAKDHQTWVNMVKEKELGGIQLFADNDWNSKFVKDYAIEGIPRFILIDPDGRIITGDAPRPSDPKLKGVLQELKL